MLLKRSRTTLIKGVWAIMALYVFIYSTSVVGAKQVTQLVMKGQRTAVWGTLCESTVCSDGICFELQSRNGTPASAKIAVEASLHKTVNTEATGHFCSENKWMTYFMSMTVYVEPTQEDLYVVYTTSED
jgi:hypothetical protein